MRCFLLLSGYVGSGGKDLGHALFFVENDLFCLSPIPHSIMICRYAHDIW